MVGGVLAGIVTIGQGLLNAGLKLPNGSWVFTSIKTPKYLSQALPN